MDKFKFKLLLLVVASLLSGGHCQPNTLFPQSPFQRPTQTQQLRQQLQQQQQRQQALAALNPLAAPLTPFNALPPISPLPQTPFRAYNQLNPQNFVPITAYQNELNYDGSFAYGYISGDGTTAQAQGYVKNLGLGEAVEAQVVQGSYSYTSPEGTPITVRYIADENGFRAEGAHIPTPPPIPDAIAKSLQYASGVQPYQQVLNPNLNPYQTPFRQFPTPQPLRPDQQLTALQLQQQQQQRFLQQQNSGQYQPGSPFNNGLTPFGSPFGGISGGFPPPGQLGGIFGQGRDQQQNLLQQQQQQNLTQLQQQQQQQQQQQERLQEQQKQQLQNAQQQQREQQQQQQQQQLVTQELRGRSSSLVNPFGYNQYRRYKKATVKK